MDFVGSRQRASERFKRILAGLDQQHKEAVRQSPFVMTPDSFFELFLVCLSWQYNSLKGIQGNWTTVDKVVRVLFNLGLATEKQRRAVFTNKRVQMKFKMHAHRVPYSTGLFSEDEIAISPRPIVIPYHIESEQSDERMLRDCRIWLTPCGKEKGDRLSSKYQRVITREQYEVELKKDAEFRELHQGRHMGAVMDNYRAKVEDEISDKQAGQRSQKRRRRAT